MIMGYKVCYLVATVDIVIIHAGNLRTESCL